MIHFGLGGDDRDLILNHALHLDDALAAQLRYGIRQGDKILYQFSPEAFDRLRLIIYQSSRESSNLYMREAFTELLRYLDYSGGMDAPDAHEAPRNQRNEFIDELREALGEREFANLDEAEAFAKEYADRFNNTPSERLRGCTPHQTRSLITYEWDRPNAPILLNKDIPESHLEDVMYFQNTKILLTMLRDEKGAKITSAGNLNRAFAHRVGERCMDQSDIPWDLRQYRPNWNEQDYMPLHIPRVICGLARLIRKSKGKFYITKKGEKLLEPEAAGELYARLFLTYYRRFDMAYADLDMEAPGIQHTFGYTLFMIRRLAADWTLAGELAESVVFPAVEYELPLSTPYSGNRAFWFVCLRIFGPLMHFGLLESESEDGLRFKDKENTPVRITPLFDKLIQFNV